MKRCISLILALLLTLSALSCASGSEENTAASTPAEGEEVQAEAEAEPDKYDIARTAFEALPPVDLGGEDFTVSAQAGVGSSETEIWVEALKGEAINDGVFDRNAAVGEQFNCNIALYAGDVNNTIRQAVTSGDQTYKLAFPNIATASAMAQSGYFLNYLDYEVLNLDAAWWDHGTAGMKIGGKIYFMSGDINILDNDVTYIQLFNKQLIDDMGLEVPYELVREGKWTIDQFSTMCRNVTSDVDGDGAYTDKDRYGYVTTGAGPNTFFYGSALSYVSFDQEGVPYLNVDADKITSVLEKVVDIVTKDNITRIPSDYNIGKAMFMDDRVLFYGEVLSYVINIREMESPFGVLPIPKFDEIQDRYYTYCEGNASTCGLPTVLTNPDEIAAVLEGMAIQSLIHVTPAYYDISLQRKYARDDESAEMLDIALANRVYDVGKFFTSLGLSDIFQSLATSGSTDFASRYAKTQKVAQKGLEKIIASFSEQQ